MFGNILESINCPRRALREKSIDYEALVGKRRSATPHFWEMESIARRGC